jgi:hypothetical protein
VTALEAKLAAATGSSDRAAAPGGGSSASASGRTLSDMPANTVAPSVAPSVFSSSSHVVAAAAPVRDLTAAASQSDPGAGIGEALVLGGAGRGAMIPVLRMPGVVPRTGAPEVRRPLPSGDRGGGNNIEGMSATLSTPATSMPPSPRGGEAPSPSRALSVHSVATTATTRRRNVSAEALAVARLMVDGYSREEALQGCVHARAAGDDDLYSAALEWLLERAEEMEEKVVPHSHYLPALSFVCTTSMKLPARPQLRATTV